VRFIDEHQDVLGVVHLGEPLELNVLLEGDLLDFLDTLRSFVFALLGNADFLTGDGQFDLVCLAPRLLILIFLDHGKHDVRGFLSQNPLCRGSRRLTPLLVTLGWADGLAGKGGRFT